MTNREMSEPEPWSVTVNKGIARRPWQTAVRARIARLDDEIRLSEEAGAEGRDADAARAAVRGELDRARQAVGDVAERSWRRRRPWLWWTGSDQEQAWLAVHAAEAHLVLARPEAAVRAELPELEAKVRANFRASDARTTSWTEMLTKARDLATPLDRYAVRETKEALFERSDGGHARMRSFRNMLVLTLGMLVFAVGVLAIPSVSDWIPLCPSESTSAADGEARVGETDTDGKQEGDDDGEGAGDESCSPDRVWQAELLGALGGLLAALAAIQRLRGFRNPYNLPLVQALLKIPAGALTGLLGLILMQGGVFFLEPQRGSALVAYVIFFGAAQDVVTRLVDRKASEIADAANPDAAGSDAAGGG